MTAGGIIQLFPSAARTVSVQSEEQKNTGEYRGILLIVKSTAVTDTPTITPSIQAYEPISATWVTIWTAAAAIASATATTYLLYPGASGGNVS